MNNSFRNKIYDHLFYCTMEVPLSFLSEIFFLLSVWIFLVEFEANAMGCCSKYMACNNHFQNLFISSFCFTLKALTFFVSGNFRPNKSFRYTKISDIYFISIFKKLFSSPEINFKLILISKKKKLSWFSFYLNFLKNPRENYEQIHGNEWLITSIITK